MKKTKAQKTKALNSHLVRTYKITLKERGIILANQKYLCPICKKSIYNQKRICVDHDHLTGKIRGVLCDNCNLGLGIFKDSKDLLTNAIQYLCQKSTFHSLKKPLLKNRIKSFILANPLLLDEKIAEILHCHRITVWRIRQGKIH